MAAPVTRRPFRATTTRPQPRARTIIALAAVSALGGCGATLPTAADFASGGCQIRAGAALTEGTASFTSAAGISADARGGAVTVIGNCPDDLSVVTRSGNSTVTYGDPEIIRAILEGAPVELTMPQLRALVR